MIKRPQRAFDLLGYEEQVIELEKAKSVIEPVAGRITSFRAPALRINENTVRALLGDSDSHRIVRLLPRGSMVRSPLVRQRS